ncbi:hypothetical protein RHMOL_Rhmol05G0039400 [Rhododendron molle]|uniref:Uncharacterized protein n=1 Tax=Rhododendron molle TaxID=49168 RepID=A0ACC0NLQ2_RHOML|nr:hypothetical protein RHMOL_Rhmol05G0039400 [Rhododendron molle]
MWNAVTYGLSSSFFFFGPSEIKVQIQLKSLNNNNTKINQSPRTGSKVALDAEALRARQPHRRPCTADEQANKRWLDQTQRAWPTPKKGPKPRYKKSPRQTNPKTLSEIFHRRRPKPRLADHHLPPPLPNTRTALTAP